MITGNNNDTAYAPWWEIDRVNDNFAWGNPNAEIAGNFLRYASLIDDKSLIRTLEEKSIKRLKQINNPEFHELLCFVRLYDFVDSPLKKEIYNSLCNLIKDVVVLDQKVWGTYVPTPLTFISGLDSPFLGLFEETLIHKNLNHLVKTLNVDHWEPNWAWGKSFPNEWLKAKAEWSGKLTVENTLKLKSFRVL